MKSGNCSFKINEREGMRVGEQGRMIKERERGIMIKRQRGSRKRERDPENEKEIGRQ